MPINSVSLSLLIVLFVWIQVPCGSGKSIPTDNGNSNYNKTKVNSTAILNSKSEGGDVTEVTSPRAPSLDHIVRKKREADPVAPFDFDTMHLPCDLDHAGRSSIIKYFSNSCNWVFNNRYFSEGYYRIFKTYQLEAFFFGQYYERLKRFEIDPHSFEYGDTDF